MDDEVIDLGVISLHPDAEVVDDKHPVAVSELPVDEVRSVAFASHPGEDVVDLLLDCRTE